MHIFLIAALSVDGFLADKSDQKSTDWTSKEDRQFFVSRTKQAQLMVMGSTTYQTIGRPLPGRITIVYTNQPNTIPNSQDVSLLPIYPASPAGGPSSGLPDFPFTTSLPPQELISLLQSKNYPELAICGGSSIFTLFMQSNTIQTLYLTIEPYVFGQGVPLFKTTLNQHLVLKQTTPLNENTLLLEYTTHQ